VKCPKCKSPMKPVEFAGIVVDRCGGCQGLWFDMLEHEHLKAIEGSESIDIGNPEVGRLYNQREYIDCPVCKTSMIRMVDREQPHIWYEACGSCFGVFFDAGEFRDYKEHSVFEFFRDLFAKERR
jgi:uncharacterized protein